MSTTSAIIALCSDGLWRGSYCHWDGYPEATGRVLQEKYNNQAEVDRLMLLGDMSTVVGDEIAYHRDRDEDLRSIVGTTSLRVENALTHDWMGFDYTYTWDGDTWTAR